MVSERMTLPELGRRLNSVETNVEKRIDGLENTVDERLNKIEENLRWIVRLVVATMFSVLGAIVIALITKNLG